jgi:predicted PurR-regulated permease PerM
MATANGTSRTIQLLVAAAAIMIIVAGLRTAQSIVVPFLLAAFIAIICAPPLYWLRRHRVPTVLALLIVIGGLVIIGLGLVTVVGQSLNEFSSNLPSYQARLQDRVDQFMTWIEQFEGRDDGGSGGEQGAAGGVGTQPADGERSPSVLLTYLDPNAAMGFVANLLASLGGVLTNAFLILITVIFILLETACFEGKLRSLLKDSEASMNRIRQTLGHVRRYVFLKTIISVITGFVIWGWLLFLGIDNAALWGLLALLLNFVPTIGSVIAAVPAVILALVQLGLGAAIWTAVGYLAVNTVIGNFIEPRVVGRGLDLSPLVVFCSLVIWGWALGPVGMLLSVPLTMAFRIAFEGHEETRWLAILLAASPPPPPPPAAQPALPDDV